MEPDANCETCGHRHQGAAFAFICVGCPCAERPGQEQHKKALREGDGWAVNFWIGSEMFSSDQTYTEDRAHRVAATIRAKVPEARDIGIVNCDT